MDARNKLHALTSDRSSKHARHPSRYRASELRLLSETLPNGRKHYFVGQGPFTRYRDAVNALHKVRDRHTEASVACLPKMVAENTF